ncbi:MAG: hypothetical protein HQL94_10650, partial [Magnetococcales bacterium]|nr:hypothetical protein [Magnetococcales bacterium]
WRRHEEDPVKMAELQRRILEATAQRVSPGGLLVYAVCSMEPEEGEEQVQKFLFSHPQWKRVMITSEECGIPAEAITLEGDFRTEPGWEGMDGFFISRLRRMA